MVTQCQLSQSLAATVQLAVAQRGYLSRSKIRCCLTMADNACLLLNMAINITLFANVNFSLG
jgi:hypothetical protein